MATVMLLYIFFVYLLGVAFFEKYQNFQMRNFKDWGVLFSAVGSRVHLVTKCYLLTCDLHDGGLAPRILLNDGHAIPALGLGTFFGFDENGQKESKNGEVEQAVSWAIQSRYRLFDTASAYNNEQQVGLAIKKSAVPRKDIYIVTKLAMNEQRNVLKAIRSSLERLNTSYVDLYLIHNPVAFKPDHSEFDIVDYLDTWRGMEEVKEKGLAKSIGISNFNISQMERLLEHCNIKPAILQVEVNLDLAQNAILEFTKKNNITVMAYSPFGNLFEKNVVGVTKVDDPSLTTLAKKYKKTVPQIVLKYLTQRGVIPIPKSVRKAKIIENINVFDFELSKPEMELLANFNKDHRTVWPSWWQKHPYYPFEQKDVPGPDIFKRN